MLKSCKSHLECVQESYWVHMRYAFGFAARLILAGLAVVIHAVCPALFQTAGSRMIFSLHDELRARAAPRHDA